MGRKKKNKKSSVLKFIYALSVIIVFLAGLYYENGYTDVNAFINDMINNSAEISTTIAENVGNTLSTENNELDSSVKEIPKKVVSGTLEMHTIDVGQRR